MKKSILIILSSLFIVITVNAQIYKGSVFLGGSLFFTHLSGYSNSGYAIGTQIGTAYNENSIIGISLNYGNGSPYNANNLKDYGGGLFLRKYRQLGKNFSLFGHGQLSYVVLKTSATVNLTDIQTTKQSTYSLSIFPGVSYALTKKFHIDVTINNLLFIGYSENKSNYTSPGSSVDTKSNTFSITMNNTGNSPFTIGFNLIL